MRRLLLFAVVTAASLLATSGGPPPAEAADCYYTCSCNGQVLRCCTTASGTTCKPATGPTPIECPQVNNC